MKISIVTAVYNGKDTIGHSIESIASQTYKDIEHVIIDGGSSDETLDIIRNTAQILAPLRCKNFHWVSEPDNGIYDAMNKGIKMATGDIIGILNSDDIYADEFVVENVVKAMSENNVESCYGDLVYVDKDYPDKVIRYWKSGDFYKERFRKGWMPPHPTFFVKREVYEKYGLLNLDFRLAADYELMLRFLYRYGVSVAYIPRVLVKMRTGGTSPAGFYTMGAIIENYRSWKVNGLKYPITVFMKPLSEIFQFFK